MDSYRFLCPNRSTFNSCSDLRGDGGFTENSDKCVEDLMDALKLEEVNDGAPNRFDVGVIN